MYAYYLPLFISLSDEPVKHAFEILLCNVSELASIGIPLAFGNIWCLLLPAQEARKHVGDEVASKTGKDEFGHCLNFPVGSLSCIAKQGSKMYTNNFRATLVASAKQRAYDAALQSAKSDGLEMSEAVRKAQKISNTAAKAQKQQVQRIIAPLFAAVWDGLEVVYYGGSLAEVTLRATGTLCGTWWGGVVVSIRIIVFSPSLFRLRLTSGKSIVYCSFLVDLGPGKFKSKV